jgi:hypothetical protein
MLTMADRDSSIVRPRASAVQCGSFAACAKNVLSFESSYFQSMTSGSVNYEYGVKYTPSTFPAPRLTAISLQEDWDIRFVRIQWADLLNNIRVRIVPVAYFKKLLASSRPGITVPKVALGLVFIALPSGFSASGEYLYVFDCATLRVCPYAPGHASVLGYFEEKVPPPRRPMTLEVDICPRSILRRVLE